MANESAILAGSHIRLEPLDRHHIDGLAAASSTDDPSFYQWSPVAQGRVQTAAYVETALAWRDAGTAAPFATVNISTGVVIGSTRFFNIERWAWPEGHERRGREHPDACEIGYHVAGALGEPHGGQYRSKVAHA